VPRSSRKAFKAEKAAARKRRPATNSVSAAMVIWPPELAKRWGVGKVTLWRYRTAGKLPACDFRLGRREGWRRATIENYEAGVAR
jgi:predicted DNA-binding transcriptional regulator AlpA